MSHVKLEIREGLPDLPPEEAFRRWRDELPRLAADLPRLQSIHERHPGAEGSRRHLVFTLDLALPPLAAAFLPGDTLVFDLAEVFGGEASSWSLHSHAVSPEAAEATGTLHFEARGNGSILVAAGTLHLDLAAIPRVPALVARSVEPTLERGIARGIEKAFAMLARRIGENTKGEG